MEDGHVLVVGSAGIDVKGIYNSGDLEWGTSNLGTIRNTVGGVARNIAENLARLELETILLTAVGDDIQGKRIIEECENTGINCDHILEVEDSRTGTYMALLKPDGQLHVAISDFEITSYIDSDYLLDHEDLFKDALMIVIDATLSEDTLETVFDIAIRYKIKVCADPTTPALASRLCPHLSHLYLVVPNASETSAMCGPAQEPTDRDSAIATAREFVSKGAGIAVVTLGKQGLAYADRGGSGFIQAVNTEIIDTTGAGDAFSGAAIFGLLNGVPVDEAMRLGITAASLTIESRHTVFPELSQDLLYEKLSI